MTTPVSLETLFRRFRSQRDTDALAELFDRTSTILLRVACHVAHDLAAAEDLVQGTFLALLEGKGAYDERRPLLPWLLGVLANQARRARRQGRRIETVPTLPPIADPSPPLSAEARELAARVAGAIDALAEPYREVARLALCDVLAPAEIARRLGRGGGAIRVQLHRALEQLRRRVEFGGTVLPWLASRAGEFGVGIEQVRARVVRHAELASAAAVAGAATAVAAGVATGTTLAVRWLGRALAVLLVTGGALVAWRSRPTAEPAPASDAVRQGNTAAIPVASAPTSPAAIREQSEPAPPPGPSASASLIAPASIPLDGERVEGVVRDGSGTPVADARLEVRALLAQVDAYILDGPLLAEGRSDADGRFAVGPVVPFAHFELVCRATGFVLRRQWVTTGCDASVDLDRGGTITGRVTDEATGAPIGGLAIAWAVRQKLESAAPPVLTDGEGRFRLDAVVEEAQVELVMRRPGAIERRHSVTTRRGVTEVAATWPATRRLRGRIVTAEDGQPIAGAEVRDGIHGNWGVPYVAGTVLAVTDAAGEFTIAEVPMEWFGDVARGGFHELRLVVSAPDRISTQFTLTPQAERNLELPLQRGLDLIGRVVGPGDEPIAGAEVTDERSRMGWDGEDASEEEAPAGPSYPGYDRAAITIGHRTDAEGRFAIRGVAPSREPRRMWVEHPSLGSESFTIEPDADFARLELRLAASATIEGTVTVGGEVAEAIVVWRAPDDEVFRSDRVVVADRAGRYRLAGLPAGRVELAVAPPGFNGFLQVVDPEFAPPVAVAAIETELGTTVRHDFRLNARRSGLAGRVVASDGQPLADADVCICGSLIDATPGPIETDYFEAHVRTDADGRFDQRVWLPPEAERAELPRMRVIVGYRSLRKIMDHVPLESADFVIELPVSVPVPVVVTASADGRPLERACFQWRAPGGTRWNDLDSSAIEPVPRVLAAGGSTELDLPQGACELVVWDPDGTVAPLRVALCLPRPDSQPLTLAMPVASGVAIHWPDRAGRRKADEGVVLLLREDELPLVRLAAEEFGNLRLVGCELDADAPAVAALLEARELKLYWEIHGFSGLAPGSYYFRSFGRTRRFHPEWFDLPPPQPGEPSVEIVLEDE